MGTIRGTALDETEGFVKALYFGNPKQGKTTAMAGAARLGKIVAIDIEGEGWLAKPLRDRGIPVENIIKYRATSYGEMEQVYWEIKGMFDDGVPIVAVCIDHMTDLEARLITDARNDRLGRVIRPLRKKAETNADAKAALEDINLFKNERDDYGVWTNQARHLMRWYRDLPCHVAFAAHYRTEVGVRVPSLTEKFRIDLMGSLNMILGCVSMKVDGLPTEYFEDDLAYVAYCREIEGWQAGDRFNVTRPIVVNPSFDRIIAATRGELDFDTDPQQQAFKQAMSA